jgi:flagellar hook-associated protein 2
MLSSNSYAGTDVVQDPSGSVIATGLSGASVGNYSIKVDSLAAGANLQDPAKANVSYLNNKVAMVSAANWAGQSISFSVNGTASSITIGAGVASVSDIVNSINSGIQNNPALIGKLSVSADASGNIQFNTLSTDTIKINSAGTSVTDLASITDKVMNPTSSTKLSDMGIAAIPNDGTFTINGTAIKAATAINTVGDLVDAINSSSGGSFNASFSQISGKLNIQTSALGSGTSISYAGADLTGFGLVASATTNFGKDAVVEITPPGATAATTVVKNSNSFSLDGINYSLVKPSTSTNTFSVNSNSQKVYDKIKDFIDKYNTLVSNITAKLAEKKDKNYPPLTDDQKKAMSETQINNWNAKAQQGLLRNDSSLNSMLNSLRTAFYDKVSAAGISLTEIGLSTSSDMSKSGQIVIDESKLKDAIQNKGSQVASLFSNSSSVSYDPDHSAYSALDPTSRYAQEGIFQRVNDIFNDYVRTSRDSKNNKGILLQKAGVKGDFSETNNTLSQQLTDQDKVIADLNTKWTAKQTAYYNQFTQMETNLNNLNSQQSWLTQQLSHM